MTDQETSDLLLGWIDNRPKILTIPDGYQQAQFAWFIKRASQGWVHTNAVLRAYATALVKLPNLSRNITLVRHHYDLSEHTCRSEHPIGSCTRCDLEDLGHFIVEAIMEIKT